MLNNVLACAREHRAEYLADLLEYLSIPSVSAQPEHARDVKMAALWLAEHLRDLGVTADVMETKGHPVVYGEWKSQHSHATTVLIYGHYDVQPAEPFELWRNDPFKPEVREGFIYARGADDNKGQHLAHIKAIESFLRSDGTLPVNVKFLIEGEEEIGSMNLGAFIASHRDLLACDCIMVSDGSLFSATQPIMTYGLRGLVDLEVKLRALDHDVHSGHYGGNVQNPAFALAELLSTVKDKHGRVLIDGFHDDVRALSETEREKIAQVPWGEAEIRRETGALMTHGDPDYTPNERKGARPTFEINGMWSGYTGAGSKTIIPATAHAKITCRLVPHQDPVKIGAAVKAHLLKHAPAGVSIEVEVRRGSPASLVERDSPQVQAAIDAATATYGNPPYFELEGGSIPVVHEFITQMQKPVVLLGFGLPDDAIHSPNERYAVECYEKGIEASIRFLSAL